MDGKPRKQGVVLLTEEMKSKMPEDVKIVHSWGQTLSGEHCVVECTQETFNVWCNACDVFIFGLGIPPEMEFIVHTK